MWKTRISCIFSEEKTDKLLQVHRSVAFISMKFISFSAVEVSTDSKIISRDGPLA